MRIKVFVACISVFVAANMALTEPLLQWKKDLRGARLAAMSANGHFTAWTISDTPDAHFYMYSKENSLILHKQGSRISIDAIALSDNGNAVLAITEQIHPGYPGYLKCYDRSGAQLWTYDNKFSAKEIRFSKNGQYVVFCDQKQLYLLDNNGSLIWRKSGTFWHCSISEKGERIVAEDENHTLYVYDRGGDLLWTYNHDRSVDVGQAAGVAVSPAGSYIAQCLNKRVSGREQYSVGLFSSNGRLIWEYSLQGEFNSAWSITVSNAGEVIFGTFMGRVYIVDKSGDLLWHKRYTDWSDIAWVSSSADGDYFIVTCGGSCYLYGN